MTGPAVKGGNNSRPPVSNNGQGSTDLIKGQPQGLPTLWRHSVGRKSPRRSRLASKRVCMSNVRCFICIIIELGSSGLIVDIVISRNLEDIDEIK